MLKKLHISLFFSNLVVSKQLSTIIVDMRNFVTQFGKNLEICKKFAGNQVNEIEEDVVCKLDAMKKGSLQYADDVAKRMYLVGYRFRDRILGNAVEENESGCKS